MQDDASSRASSVEVIEIHKQYLRPDPNQPRKHFDPETIERRRVQLEEDGQKSPITVFPGELGEDGQLYYDIQDGECRWRAAMASSNIEFLRAEVDTITRRDDLATIRLNQLLHNDDGSEPLTPLERAYAYRDIVQALEAEGVDSPKTVAARRLGLSLSVFSEVLGLAALPNELGAFALAQGITDSRVIAGLVQVNKRGSKEDVERVKQQVSAAIAQGGNLRQLMKQAVEAVKAERPLAKKVPKTAKKEKKVRNLRAQQVVVSTKPDGSAVLTIETGKEVLKVSVTAEQVNTMMPWDDVNSSSS
ncbi:MAG: ParB N-terminal domain-containing protein [Marinobacter sp.]|nr:ParB N-terminal domain-containing protein [Marinobacter sp.]